MELIRKQHFVINLDRRPERLVEAKEELKKIGIDDVNRFKAIENEIGLIGCGMSHKRCIELAIENDWNFVAIFEDDVIFPNPEKCTELIDKYMNYHFDVLFLGCQVLDGYMAGDDIIRVKKAYCLHGYIVRSHYYRKFLINLQNGLQIKKNNIRHHDGNCDVYINELIPHDRWYCLSPCQASQRDGYSDNFLRWSSQKDNIFCPKLKNNCK
jgi:hypothetical protein